VKEKGITSMNDLVDLQSLLKESYLTRAKAQEYIRSKGYTITDHYLQSCAARRIGPQYRMFGNQVIYTTHDIDAWIASPRFLKNQTRLPNNLIIKTA
jgi:hypothetical protein